MSDQELRATFDMMLHRAMNGEPFPLSHSGMTGMTLNAIMDVAKAHPTASIALIAKAKQLFEWQLDGTQAQMQSEMRRSALANARNRSSRA